MKKKFLAFIFVTVWVELAAISIRSDYSICDVKSLNWDIALMLTPWGFIHNFLIVPDHYLRPYYDATADRGALFDDPVLAIFVVATVASCLTGLIYFRRTQTRTS